DDPVHARHPADDDPPAPARTAGARHPRRGRRRPQPQRRPGVVRPVGRPPSVRVAHRPPRGAGRGRTGPGRGPHAGMTDLLETAAASELDALDAYSAIVTSVADRVVPAVAALRVGGGARQGAGSGVVVTPDGYLLTSAHVVAAADGGTAEMPDGRELDFTVV